MNAWRGVVAVSLLLPLAGGCSESSPPAAEGLTTPDSGSAAGSGGMGGGRLEDAGGPLHAGTGSGRADASSPVPGNEGTDAAPEAAICLDFTAPAPIGALQQAGLDQLSGLVASRSQPGVLFAHEDSTGEPIVYALALDGRALAELTLDGAPNTDWEDIALGSAPDGTSQLFIGDIGDNAVRTGGAARAEIQVIRLAEPRVALSPAGAEQTLSSFDVLRFTYPSGVHEAETLLVDPRSGDLLIVTRSAVGDSRIFRAPASTPPETPTVLQEIGRVELPTSGQAALATGGDFSPSGDRILVRTYTDVYLWPAPAQVALETVLGQPPRVVHWADEPQGEGISFAADGRAWLSAGEQDSTLYRAEQDCP